MQLQFEDRVGLDRGERLLGIKLRRAPRRIDVDLLPAKVQNQVLAGIGAVGAATNDRDHVVEVIERREITFENVLTVLGLLQQVCSSASNHVHAVINKNLDR